MRARGYYAIFIVYFLNLLWKTLTPLFFALCHSHTLFSLTLSYLLRQWASKWMCAIAHDNIVLKAVQLWWRLTFSRVIFYSLKIELADILLYSRITIIFSLELYHKFDREKKKKKKICVCMEEKIEWERKSKKERKK